MTLESFLSTDAIPLDQYLCWGLLFNQDSTYCRPSRFKFVYERMSKTPSSSIHFLIDGLSDYSIAWKAFIYYKNKKELRKQHFRPFLRERSNK